MKRQYGIWVMLVALAGCAGDQGGDGRDPYLTSSSGVERKLTIKGYVYVDQNADAYTIQNAVQQQVRTAFGPLRIGQISVDDREFRTNVDPTSFVKTNVDVVKKDSDGKLTTSKTVARVDYTYKARALISSSIAESSTFSMTLLMGNYQSFVGEILDKCTENPSEDREFSSSFWYVWAPDEYRCKELISGEATAVDKERQALKAGDGQIGETEYGRRYLPLNAELKPADAPPTTYPEYDRLYGLKDPSKTRVVVYYIAGVAAHSTDPVSRQFEHDMGFVEFFKALDELATQYSKLQVAADSQVNPLAFEHNGKKYEGTFAQLHSWVVSESDFPTEIKVEDRDAFRRAIHDNMKLKWIKLEVPLKLRTPEGDSKSMTLEMRLIFGTEGDYGMFGYLKEAYRNADVVLYNGHSYIGSSYLDAARFSASDFSSNYQIFFFNSCVSFNYYGVSYFKLKDGGSKNLELVTNGLEVPIWDGGKSMGQFITSLFDGRQNSWLDVMKKTQAGWTDPNRNVDGELDNVFDPAKSVFTVEQAQ
jgi:hypothetical protein